MQLICSLDVTHFKWNAKAYLAMDFFQKHLYSRVHISSDKAFFKILNKSSIEQK